jgi:hypothetical protein
MELQGCYGHVLLSPTLVTMERVCEVGERGCCLMGATRFRQNHRGGGGQDRHRGGTEADLYDDIGQGIPYVDDMKRDFYAFDVTATEMVPDARWPCRDNGMHRNGSSV